MIEWVKTGDCIKDKRKGKESQQRRILGCSYRASSLRIAIRLPTDATVYFVYLFPLLLPYMFRALISPSSGVSQAVFLYTTIWFMWCLCCSTACACGLVCRGGFTVLVPWWFSCTSGSVCACGLVYRGGFTVKPPR